MSGKSVSEIGYVCSPMNYIGGKYKLLPQLLPLFPKKINTFVDLFCGGCNVGINATAEKIVFNDNLIYLIDLYNAFLSSNIDSILTHIEKRILEFSLSLENEQGYKALRDLYNTNRDPLDLFVLVAYSFNHQIRFNNSHQFNNPFGRERSSFNDKMRSNLVYFLGSLNRKCVEFRCSNFDKFGFDELTSGDYVYCDPPYLISTGTYNDGKRGFTGWGHEEERTLLDILMELDHKNIWFGLSNVISHKGKRNDMLMEWVEGNGYNIYHLNKNYSNSNYHIKNVEGSVTDEVFITNFSANRDLQLTLFF